ncbi:uncharacterized protein LOC134222660 [Armigeres subalbatus]|uniref:uncharacterized protein LOC134222660 n=1 Tax=Armigeres subalbatus TaxID=124917 RepID=UPI002ED57D41
MMTVDIDSNLPSRIALPPVPVIEVLLVGCWDAGLTNVPGTILLECLLVKDVRVNFIYQAKGITGSGFNLRKWNSNSQQVLKSIPSYLRDDRQILDLDEKATVKTLGLTWEPATDTLWIKVPDWRPGGPITHRVVLSEIARLFDPYGLVGPVVVLGKLFLQELWKAKYSWDEPLSQELQTQWLEFRSNLFELDAASVPRWIGFGKDIISCEFHGFSDSSDKAYGAAVYLRCMDWNGDITVNLLMAKSKVAPLEDFSRRKKKQSIPRLELSAALLLAHLYDTVSTSMAIEAKSFFWTDSTIVKCWISSHPSRWQAFVANRVSEIQHVTKGKQHTLAETSGVSVKGTSGYDNLPDRKSQPFQKLHHRQQQKVRQSSC